ncbi:conserved membrane protein of unknown function [Pseudodesulfovibrio profundus]|uniref:DUF4079 domain-containing protein n=1 Tax=Pseudodesulfovibrio profundus TaxID=57320 RepID=A0A2C8F9S2_9BACT|nr:hypothetical protein [Pseudodesulfovibrio profundus]SOB59301.1 conserved membrane protein of unknown function [Pseudodesulfovibrio profundus]|tara:strand:- start:38 stop:469 length:432 start_codon:yes stop_codon:yes gene_type:complete
MLLMWVHPLIQSVAMILAVYVLYLGIQRFRFQHLKVRCPFNWKRHVLLGKVVHGLWAFGACLGLYMAYYAWGSIDLTGGHFTVGVLMLPVIVAALISGLILEKPKGKRANLALFHGSCNVLLFLMACYQSYTAIEVINLFLLH